MIDTSIAIGLTTLVVGSWVCYAKLFKVRARGKFDHLPLPPGPNGLPVIGNLLQYPMEKPWEVFLRWGEELQSKIVYMNMAGRHLIVINSRRVAKEIFERRSARYSTRPHFVMVKELMGWAWQFCFLPNDSEWRAKRRAFQQGLHPSKVEVHQPHEVTYTHRLLRNLLRDPDNFVSHIRHLSGATTLAMAYGIHIKPTDDRYLAIAEKAIVGLTIAGMPGKFLVEAFPFLKYVPPFIPGAGFQRQAKAWARLANDMLKLPFEEAQRSIEQGNPSPSFCTNGLRELEREGMSGDSYEMGILQDTAGAMFVGGADTTVSAMVTFIMMMALHPEIQARAQNEMDNVIGTGRLPTHSDEPRTPYMAAIVKEVLRSYPVTPLAVPHAAEEEDEFEGYRIPAGATIIGNAWAMLHNEDDYQTASTFDPCRFLSDNGELNPDAHEPVEAFGFGRRVCPAKHIAISTLWLAMACLISTFDIKKKLMWGTNDSEVEITVKYSAALVSHAFPFECDITPRSLNAARLINATEATSMNE